jgi:hypothetical protein
MALREFTDSNGATWRVWSNRPSNPAVVSPEMRDGWLTFDSGWYRLRLAPIPAGWDAAEVERLQLLSQVATRARLSDPFLEAIRDTEERATEQVVEPSAPRRIDRESETPSPPSPFAE